MKIAYCIAGTYNSGGMERVLANKANWLVRHGHEVVIITTDQRGHKPFFPLHASIKCIDLDINYDANNGSLLRKLVQYPMKQLRHIRRLREALMQERPDITVSMFCNDVDFVTKLGDGSRKVLEVHFSRFKRLQYQRYGLWGVIDRYRSNHEIGRVMKFDRFVALTHQDYEYWEALPNSTVIPNACVLDLKGRKAALEAKRVIAVGRLDFQKNFERLIEVWREIAPEFPDWQLGIIGRGPDREKLQALINEYGLQDYIKLEGETRDIASIYLGGSILAMTSRYEGFPMVLIEAQSAGLPIVSFDCKCGPRDIIADGVSGFLIPEGDTHRMAERLKLLMSNASLREDMGAAARANSQHYHEDAIMARWMKLFNNL